MELLGRLRRAVKKLTFLLNLKKYLTTSTWKLASMIRTRAPATITGAHRWGRRAYSFNDRPGLRACVDVVVVDNGNHHHHHHYYYHSSPDYDGSEEDNGCRSVGSSGPTSPYPLRRATSTPVREENVDNQAEMFIENFYKHLLLEKQVSLNLRYCRDYGSSFTSSTGDSIVSPLSSADSQLVSPT